MRETIRYMERTRLFYEAQGFEKPYQWAHFDDIPFHRPDKPLSESTVAIVTTAISDEDRQVPMVSRTARSIPIDRVPERFFTDDLSWDKVTTHTDDRGSYFPLEPLVAMQDSGVIGRLAPRYHFVPTEYSQRQTIDSDAPTICEACIEDEVDVAILVPL
jgi:D-proline reductase (dithiol) PrdB